MQVLPGEPWASQISTWESVGSAGDLAAGFPFTAGAQPGLWSSWRVLITKNHKALLHGKSEDLVKLLPFVLSSAILLLEWICSGSNSPLLTIQYLDAWLIGGCLHPRIHLSLECLKKSFQKSHLHSGRKKDALGTLYSSLSPSLISL